MIIYAAAGGAFVIIVAVIIAVFLCKRKKRQHAKILASERSTIDIDIEAEAENDKPQREFTQMPLSPNQISQPDIE